MVANCRGRGRSDSGCVRVFLPPTGEGSHGPGGQARLLLQPETTSPRARLGTARALESLILIEWPRSEMLLVRVASCCCGQGIS